MAIVKFIPARKSQSSGGLHGSMEYCKQEHKTWDEGTKRHLVTGVNCVADTAYREFRIRKQILHGFEETSETGYEYRSQGRTRLSGNGEELDWSAGSHGWNPGDADAVYGADADTGNTGGSGKDPGPAADDDAGSPGRHEGSDDGIPYRYRNYGEQFRETGWESERGIFQDTHQRRSTYAQMEQEADLDFRDSFGSTGSAGTGAAALVGSLSRLKGTSDDPEERKREMEAKRNAVNLGMAMGLAIAVAETLQAKKQTEMEKRNQEHQLMQ